jgi:Lrp/AsnC family leucine-responsive transcriptional regulator
MDAIDLSILGALERDARQSFASLSEAVGLSKTPCWARVQELEKSGAIRGYNADINPRAVGLGVFAFIEVKIDFNQRQAFETAASNNPAILECYTTAGEGDYLLKIVCRDVDDLDDLLRFNISLMPGLQRSTTMICLKTVKARSSTTAAAEPYVIKTRKR